MGWKKNFNELAKCDVALISESISWSIKSNWHRQHSQINNKIDLESSTLTSLALFRWNFKLLILSHLISLKMEAVVRIPLLIGHWLKHILLHHTWELLKYFNVNKEYTGEKKPLGWCKLYVCSNQYVIGERMCNTLFLNNFYSWVNFWTTLLSI